MSDQDEAQKTEEPTEKKLRDAREKGQVAKSREVNNWMMLLAGALIMFVAGGFLFGGLRHLLSGFFEHPHAMMVSGSGAGRILRQALTEALLLLGLPMLGFVIAATLGNVMQHGFFMAPEGIKPKLSKISPLSGLKRMFSLKSIVEFLKGLFKIALTAGVAAMLIVPAIGNPARYVEMSAAGLLGEIEVLVLLLLSGVVAVMTVVAGLDWLYQVYDFRRQMRMTKQEIKDEFKQSEGDPHVKGKLKQIRMERARQRMMAAVPEADVVITNPEHYAVALAYKEDEMAAPKCLAKGTDEVAQRIKQLAGENDIPIVEDPPLARALFAGVEVGHEVPPEHYRAVAQVISYVFGLRRGGSARYQSRAAAP